MEIEVLPRGGCQSTLEVTRGTTPWTSHCRSARWRLRSMARRTSCATRVSALLPPHQRCLSAACLVRAGPRAREAEVRLPKSHAYLGHMPHILADPESATLPCMVTRSLPSRHSHNKARGSHWPPARSPAGSRMAAYSRMHPSLISFHFVPLPHLLTAVKPVGPTVLKRAHLQAAG